MIDSNPPTVVFSSSGESMPTFIPYSDFWCPQRCIEGVKAMLNLADGFEALEDDIIIASEFKTKTLHLHESFGQTFYQSELKKIIYGMRSNLFQGKVGYVHCGSALHEIILQTAKQCRIAVLVLSEEFFSRSEWPMLEVQTFLDAQTSGRNPHLKIIPLFFRMLWKDFEARALNWVQKWKEWAISDDRIDVVKWQEAVQILKRIKGIEFQPGMREVAYRRSIVQTICELVPADNRANLTYIHGSQRISKIMKPVMTLNVSEGQYHPWTLNVIGRQLGSNANSWLENKKSLNFEYLFSEMKETFKSFLSEKHKKIFLDIALHATSDLRTVEDVCHWLALEHEMEYNEMILVLKDLKSKCLLYEWENGISRWMRMHELCREFAKSISNKKQYSMACSCGCNCSPLERIGLPNNKFQNPMFSNVLSKL
eukprot:Gb_17867 [translate_table: standard]